jgi:hypothetical protein
VDAIGRRLARESVREGGSLAGCRERRNTLIAVWILIALLVLLAIVGGVTLSKLLFFVLVVAALVALISFFARRTA